MAFIGSLSSLNKFAVDLDNLKRKSLKYGLLVLVLLNFNMSVLKGFSDDKLYVTLVNYETEKNNCKDMVDLL